MARLSPFSFLAAISFFISSACGNNFYQDVDVTWGDGRGQILDGGNLLSLTLDRDSGSGFQSKRGFLFGRFDVQMKLVPGNSAGTVTTFFLASYQGQARDEIDLEFLGNLSGSPYTLHTNIYTKGKGYREQQFNLWFDPTNDFHTYSVIWNPYRIIILVDQIPIRVFENQESIGLQYPNNQTMMVFASIWNADQWATRGGQVKTDWSKSPFTAYYRNFSFQTTDSGGDKTWYNQGLNYQDRKWIRWAQKYHMIYNYCNDPRSNSDPRECRRSRFL